MHLTLDSTYEHPFSITQAQVNAFAELSGDHNPLHLNAAYAAQTPFKRPIVHGMFSITVFTQVMGTHFPGEGTVYLQQQVAFKRPVYPGEPYVARFRVLEIDRRRHRAKVETQIFHTQTGKVAVEGMAEIMNQEKIGEG